MDLLTGDPRISDALPAGVSADTVVTLRPVGGLPVRLERRGR
jgi:hypothetical protein